MKRFLLIILFLLFASPSYGWMNLITAGGGVPAGTAYNSTDATRGFESDSDPTGWAETDTGSILNRHDSGNSHSGSYAMSIAGNDSTEAYYRYDMGAEKTDLSECIWFYVPTSSGGDDAFIIASWSASTGTHNIRCYLRKSSGNYTFGIRGGSFVYGTTNITAGAWYRLELDLNKNATSTLTVYNTSGSQVDQISDTANNNTCQYLYIGRIGTMSTTTWGTFYYDDFGVDYTDATTPLWEYEVSN